MTEAPLIKSVMTAFPYTIDVGCTVREARSAMRDHGVRHLPVSEGDDLVGVITDRDIKRASDPSIGLPPETELFVKDICVFKPYVVDVGERLDTVLLTMAERRIGSVLVVRKGRLVGIFTTTDACRAYGRYLRALFPLGDGEEVA